MKFIKNIFLYFFWVLKAWSKNFLSSMIQIFTGWGFHPSNRVLTFVENHDNGENTLNPKISVK